MPDSDYVVDCALQLLEITPDTHTSVSHSFMDINNFFKEHEKLKIPKVAHNNTLSCVYDLTISLDNWLLKQKEEKIAHILSSNVWESHYQIKELINKITSNAVDSYLKNNGIYPTKGTILDLLNGDDVPLMMIKNESDICFPANIAAFIMNDLRINSYVQRMTYKMKELVDLKVPFCAIEEYNNSFKKEKDKREIEYYNAVKSGKINDDVLFEKIKMSSGNSEKIEKKGRKVLKKSLNKFLNLFPKERISAFINGSGFLVEGNKFKWLFTQRQSSSLIHLSHSPLNGHIPYNLTILTKDDIVLSDVCVYVSGNTPIFDQIIAVTLFIEHDEEYLLENCNFYNVREKEYDRFCVELKGYKTGLVRNNGSFFDFDPIDEYRVKYDSLIQKYESLIKKEIHKIFGFNEKFMDFLMKDKSDLLKNNQLLDFKEILNIKNIENLLINEC